MTRVIYSAVNRDPIYARIKGAEPEYAHTLPTSVLLHPTVVSGTGVATLWSQARLYVTDDYGNMQEADLLCWVPTWFDSLVHWQSHH